MLWQLKGLMVDLLAFVTHKHSSILIWTISSVAEYKFFCWIYVYRQLGIKNQRPIYTNNNKEQETLVIFN